VNIIKISAFENLSVSKNIHYSCFHIQKHVKVTLEVRVSSRRSLPEELMVTRNAD
jgi:hypothetical protein